jgi:FAD/FMN-containing dehydrogenase
VDLADLNGDIAADIVTPESDDYAAVRKLWNGMIDHRPAAIIRCRSREEVSKAIRYATSISMEIAVRGGGHSLPGHSVCDGGLVIDLGRMNNVTVDPQARVAHVGGGALLRDLDQATRVHGMAVPAGAVSHTGVGGLTLGGGFGHLMRAHGLTIDSLLEVEIVLADGSIRRANEREHPDLFWAVRGGGGNFGVVTEFAFRTHQVGDPYIGIALHELADAGPLFRHWRETMKRDTPNEFIWFMFIRYADTLPGVPAELRGRPMVLSLLQWHGDHKVGIPYVDGVLKRLNGAFQTTTVMPFLKLQTMTDESCKHGNQAWAKSGFFSEMSDDLIKTLIDCGAEITSPMTALEVLSLGGTIADVPSEETAYPYRSAPMSFNIVCIWDDPSKNEEYIKWVKRTYARLGPYQTGGAYINFMGGDETGGANAAFGTGGTHIDRLRKIKLRYDPNNVFHHNFNIVPNVPA